MPTNRCSTQFIASRAITIVPVPVVAVTAKTAREFTSNHPRGCFGSCVRRSRSDSRKD
ncbi:hypothetical protein [Actinopolyspora mzabensis]|uniref:hypothetical protein n=1 Tax=Actinopolyspora mzabensis TaxID=995066 RepID=UPI0015A3EC67|nr:hypothetical protein [Actinopolyspora mzabensis]